MTENDDLEQRAYELNRKINKMYSKKILRKRWIISFVCIGIVGMMVGGVFIGGFVYYRNNFPVGSESITWNGTEISISDVEYEDLDNAGLGLIIELESDSEPFPNANISASKIWFIPTNSRMIWSWMDTWEVDLVFDSYWEIDNSTAFYNSDDQTNEYDAEAFNELLFRVVVQLNFTTSESYLLGYEKTTTSLI